MVVASIGEDVVVASIGEAVVASIGEAVVASIGEAVVVSSIGEAVVVVSTGEDVVAVVTGTGEEPISKLILNRWLLIRGRVPEKTLFIMLLMSVLGTTVLETINPDEIEPD